MSKTTVKETYRCMNDCLPQGCPSHEASLTYESVSDSMLFDDGKGSQISMQAPEIGAFLSLLSELRERIGRLDMLECLKKREDA